MEIRSPFTGLDNLSDAFAFLATTRGFRLVFGEPSLSENARVWLRRGASPWYMARDGAHPNHTQKAFEDYIRDLEAIGNSSTLLDESELRLRGGGTFTEGTFSYYLCWVRPCDTFPLQAVSRSTKSLLRARIASLRPFTRLLRKPARIPVTTRSSGCAPLQEKRKRTAARLHLTDEVPSTYAPV